MKETDASPASVSTEWHCCSFYMWNCSKSHLKYIQPQAVKRKLATKGEETDRESHKSRLWKLFEQFVKYLHVSTAASSLLFLLSSLQCAEMFAKILPLHKKCASG